MKPSQIKSIKMTCVSCDNTEVVDLEDRVRNALRDLTDDAACTVLKSLHIEEAPDGEYIFTGVCPLCEKRNKQKKVVWN